MISVIRQLLLFCLTGALFCAPVSAWASVPSADDAMLFDVRVDQLRAGEGVRGYAMGDTTCLNFADLANVLDIAVDIDPTRQRASGWIFNERNIFRVDRTKMEYVLNGRVRALPANAIVDADGGWCVEQGQLAQWLGIDLETDHLNALLLVHSEKPLPIQAALERIAKGELLEQQARGLNANTNSETLAIPYRPWRTPSFDITAGVNAEKGEFGANYEVFGAGEMVWMSAEARMASDKRGKLRELRGRLYRADPDANILGPLRATEVALGDVSSFTTRMVSRSVAGRGAYLTNRPLDLPSRFDVTSFRGDLPIGWDAELFRNGELIGLSGKSSDGRYEFLNVPLVYGSNAFEIVRHGPQGQTRRERHVFEVGAQAVPAKQLWWWTSAQQDNHDLLGIATVNSKSSGWRMGGGVEYGLGLRTSVAASAQSMVHDQKRTHFVEAEVRQALGPMTVTLAQASDLHSGNATKISGLGRIAGFRFGVEALLNKGLATELLDSQTKSFMRVTADRSLKLGSLLMPVSFDLAQTKRVDGANNQSFGLRSSLTLRNLSATLFARGTRSALPATAYGPMDGTVGMLLSARKGRGTLRGEVNYAIGRNRGFADARLTGEWALSARSNARLGAGYSWQDHESNFTVGYSHQFDKFTLAANAEGNSKGQVTAGLNLLFSIGSSANGRFGRISSERLAQSGAVAVQMYRDLDGNGQREAGEPLEEEARIRVAEQSVPTGRKPGEDAIMLRGLAPASPIKVGIDAASLVDPQLDPAIENLRVVPRKGLLMTVQLGVMATGLVEGILVREDGSMAANLEVALIDQSGKMVAKTLSDYDGSFIFEKVRYGQYKLQSGKATAVVPAGLGGPSIVLNHRTTNVRVGRVTVPRITTQMANLED